MPAAPSAQDPSGMTLPAYQRALPYWRNAQRAVSRKLGEPRTEALVGLLDFVESLHPDSATAPES